MQARAHAPTSSCHCHRRSPSIVGRMQEVLALDGSEQIQLFCGDRQTRPETYMIKFCLIRTLASARNVHCGRNSCPQFQTVRSWLVFQNIKDAAASRQDFSLVQIAYNRNEALLAAMAESENKIPCIDVFYHQSSEQHPGHTARAPPISRGAAGVGFKLAIKRRPA
jgi:hypothetical protein